MEATPPTSDHLTFSRDQWASRRDATPLPLTEDEIRELSGRVEPVSVDGVRDIYLPLSRLLNLRVAAACQLRETTTEFLGRSLPIPPSPIGRTIRQEPNSRPRNSAASTETPELAGMASFAIR